MSALVEFDNVSFGYATSARPVLEHVSFAVRKGEACALVGANGSGKSTSLRLLLGLDFPQAGEIRFAGEPVTERTMADRAFAKRLRQRVGLVFQDPDVQLFCPTVAEEISFGPRQMGLEDDEVARRTEDCLRIFDLEGLRDRAPWRLSGGEKRRCAIACVVSLAPDLLCLDEPTNGLDERSYQKVVEFLLRFVKSGKTVLVATHDRPFAEALGSRAIELGQA